MFKFCLVFMLTSVLLLAACVPDQAPGETVEVTRLPLTAVAPPPSPIDEAPNVLLAHNWQLTAAGGEADDMFLPQPPAALHFTVNPDPNGSEGYSFDGFSGCNTLFGSYVVLEESLVMDVGQTEQDCGADFMAFENYMLAILRSSPTYAISSENGEFFLILQLPDNETERLVFMAVAGV
ncbi:MAG: META domain-containing protein [Anaerolineales bacterium]|nr:META domain-containing protein [Anaerolineales bacterium]